MSLEEEVKEEKKSKKLGFWDKIWNKGKLKKPEKVAVLYLRKNGGAIGYDVETKKGFFEVEKKTYHIDRDCIYRLGKDRVPLAIIEEEGLKPLPTKEFYDNLHELNAFERKAAEYQDLVLKAIRHAELVKLEGRDGSKINPKVAIGIGIAIVIGFAIFKAYSG